MLLDKLLEGLNVGVAPFAICEVRRDASLLVEDAGAASLHYVLSGHGWVRMPSGSKVALAPHSVMIAPPGARLLVSSGEREGAIVPSPRCKPLPGGWEWSVSGDGPPGLLLACGAVEATHQQTVGLFDYLPAPLVESVADDQAFRAPFERLLGELAAPRPGTRSLAEALMKECLIALLRRHCESGECRVPWLAALENPRLGRAISALLEHPESAHSLNSLAELAGMSRASFASHFRQAFGRTAMDLLKEIRLRRAAELLRATDLPIKTVAGRVGFSSRSYFSRAFKALAGADPAHYRATVRRSGTELRPKGT